MTKIFFPYNDQPIRFPFYINDLVYYWEVGSDGITVYLLNNKIDPDMPIVKDILLEETGISMYLDNETTDTSKHILVEFAKIGWSMDTLGLLDPLTLGEIDLFTLGEIAVCYANWLDITASVIKAGIAKIIEASNAEMQLNSNAVLPYIKDIYIGKLYEKIGIVGLNSFNHITINDLDPHTIGDLDPHTIGDINAMLSISRVFGSIPASLVKEIRIIQNNLLDNNTLHPIKEFEVSASNVGCHISVDSKANSSVNVALVLTEHYIGITNGNVPLEVTIDGAG